MPTSLFKLFLTSAVAASLICTAMPQGSQQELFVPVNDVSFTIGSERRVYKIGEQVKINYTVRNLSGRAVFIPRGEWSATCPSSPKVWAWFENSSGKHFMPGYAGSCSPNQMSAKERMRKEALLLKPGEAHHDYFLLDSKTFSKVLTPGRYRIEAALYAWRDADFDDAQKSELRGLGHPFLRGESAASTAIRLYRK